MTKDNPEAARLLMEQYKLYVEMADRISARRADMNKFYVTLLTSLLAVIAVADSNLFKGISDAVLIVGALLGLSLCWVWYVNVRCYKQLNSGKFEIVHQMEAQLPFRCYDCEWDILGRGKDPKLYQPISHVEMRVPALLAVPYLLLLIYALWPAIATMLQAMSTRI